MGSRGFISSPIRKNGHGGSKNMAPSIEGRRTDGGISPDNSSCLAAARALDRVGKVLHPFELFSPCEDFSASSASPALRQWAGASAVSSSLPVLVLALSLSPWLRASALKSFLRRLVAAPPLCGAANPGCRRFSGGATHWKASPQASSFLTLFHEISRAAALCTDDKNRSSHCHHAAWVRLCRFAGQPILA